MNKIVEIDGLKFECREDVVWDEHIISDELKGNMYSIPEHPRIVVDIGAHIGGTAILCAKRGATVYAYEPKKDTFDLLVKNTILNGFQDRIHCFNKGVGNPGKRKLWLSGENSGMPSLMDKQFTQMRDRYEMVDIISFDDVMKNIPHCNLLKVDCEGAEWEFLLDLSEELSKKIDRIAAELHFENNEVIGKHLEEYYEISAQPSLDNKTANRFINCVKL